MNPLLKKLRDERASLKATIDESISSADKEDRDLTDVEDKNLNDSIDRIKELDARIEHLSEIELRNAAASELAAKVDKATGVKYDEAARVTNEQRTYTMTNERHYSFFTDAYRKTFSGDPFAAERIERHLREESVERRDGTTANYSGLVVPQYLTDQVVEKAREGRVVANNVNRQPLPANGMTINVGRVTTGTATAVQASENAAVQETDLDDTLLTIDVRTIAGQQDISRQALERGSGVDALIMADLANDYAVRLDLQVINGSGSSGQMLGILNTGSIQTVTYTDATPTVAEAYPKFADAMQKVNSNRFAQATKIFMHPRRWAWLVAGVDTTNRPLVVPYTNGPTNAIGVGDPAVLGNPGQLLGLPVYTDANIPTNLGAGTNEDIIIVTRADDLVLWESGSGAPAELRFEQTLGGNLTVKMVVYGYAAFTAGRYPASVCTIGGTGFVTPTF